MKIRLAVCAGAAALGVCAATVGAAAAPHGAGPTRVPGTPVAGAPVAGTTVGGTAVAGTSAARTTAPEGPGAARLQAALDGVHRAGMPGVFAEVRADGRTWRGASGVADLATGRPVRADMRHRVGSITKTFTAAAVMQQVEQGRIRLDAPIGDYLPQLVPGERGRRITVRMLLNHTSGIPDHIRYAFPSLQELPSPTAITSLDDNRFRRFRPAELIELGLAAPPAGEPGGPVGVYSNTNYLILGQLLEHVTGTPYETYVARHVIARAGLRHTSFPAGPRIEGPHSRMYEALFGVVAEPHEYSVYDMSWVGPGAALVSTVEDLDRFYGRLLAGRVVSRASLAQMQRTGPVIALDGTTIQYGLGLTKLEVPGCGTYWGQDGTAWGAGTRSMTRSDGRRQVSVAFNLQRWNALDASGRPRPHPIDAALETLFERAMCGAANAPAATGPLTPATGP